VEAPHPRWRAGKPGRHSFQENRVRDDDPLRSGLQISAISLLWTVASGSAAVAIGITRGSLLLVAFGLTGALDAVGSATLVLHFRHALHRAEVSERRERIALHIITLGLIVLGVGTSMESARRLILSAPTDSAPEGVVLAAMTTLALAWLGITKRRLGRSIPSSALVADGWVSTTGSLLAIVTLTGTAVNATLGWQWVDPAAALLVGVGAVVIAVELRAEA
jgi:divalent metal cation (Fe/Co/Zn/Cd) transporter